MRSGKDYERASKKDVEYEVVNNRKCEVLVEVTHEEDFGPYSSLYIGYKYRVMNLRNQSLLSHNV